MDIDGEEYEADWKRIEGSELELNAQYIVGWTHPDYDDDWIIQEAYYSTRPEDNNDSWQCWGHDVDGRSFTMGCQPTHWLVKCPPAPWDRLVPLPDNEGA